MSRIRRRAATAVGKVGGRHSEDPLSQLMILDDEALSTEFGAVHVGGEPALMDR